jgi:hypothetical protein
MTPQLYSRSPVARGPATGTRQRLKSLGYPFALQDATGSRFLAR